MNVKILPVYVDDVELARKLIGHDLQIVRARCIEEVMHAVMLSLRAFGRGTCHAKTVGGEILIRLAGTPQIREAIQKVGLNEGFNYAVLLGRSTLPEGLLETRDEGRCDEKWLKDSFERMAMVDVI